MLCKGCKREIEDDSKFCEYCGAMVEKESQKSFCSSCGKQVDNNSLFCKHCGASVDSGVTVSQKGDKQKTTDLVLKIIIVVLLAIVVFFAIRHFAGNTNTENGGSKTGGAGTNNIPTADVNYGPTGGGNEVSANGESGTNKAIEVNGIYYTIVDNALYLSGEGTVDIKTINSFSKADFDKVIFESGNIDIPDDAFSGFSNIKDVELRNYVRKIGARAFKGCGFWMIAIGKSVTEIGDDAFADCEISTVYLNNPEIRANLNRRDDFGGLFEYASTIAVFYGSSQSGDDDFTLDASKWGQYLKNNDEFSEIQAAGSKAISLTKQKYDLWAHAIRPGFFHFNYTTGLEPKEDTEGALIIDDYNGETNTFTFRG